jgi:putative transposase
MANTFTCLQYHVVFSTKHREPWLRPEIEGRVWAYLGGVARQNELKPLLIGGVDDHIHTLLAIPPSMAVSEAVKQVKGGSSGWIKQNISGCRAFGWQDGYGAFTVSKSQEIIPWAEAARLLSRHRYAVSGAGRVGRLYFLNSVAAEALGQRARGHTLRNPKDHHARTQHKNQ